MTSDNSLPNEFTASYYDIDYFVTINGKRFKKSDGSSSGWSYGNESGYWDGGGPIANAWKHIFNPKNMLDVGCGRGVFVYFSRKIGIECHGFDYSKFAINNKYPKCDPKWLTCTDATHTPWLYGDKQFDLVIVLDLMEHLYNDGDIYKVINEIYRVSKKWVFLQIATCGSGGLQGESGFQGYMLKKGEKVPIEYEGLAVAGHVTVQGKQFWIDKLIGDGSRKWKLRDDLVTEFIKRVDPAIIANWVLNTILVLEVI